MVSIKLIPASEFQRIQQSNVEKYAKLELLADMCRANALSAVKRAGSGHLGSSFSAMDIVTWLYYAEMNTLQVGLTSPERDIYFSSKGHDVPGLYSLLFSVGIIEREQFLKLRRLGGLDGHPNVATLGIEASSGSLGMGISKGRGMAWAKRFKGYGGRVFVITGDGELQEGQNYEALQTTVHHKISNLFVIIDHNKVQSDKQVCEIIDLGNLEEKLRCFGWHVARCNGHSFQELDQVMNEFKHIVDKPKVLIADTIKGRGVSFMEHPVALAKGGGYYRWHAGAPDDQSFTLAHEEIISRLDRKLSDLELSKLELEDVTHDSEKVTTKIHNELGEPVSTGKTASSMKAASEYVVEAYGKALLLLAENRENIVVLDADLAADCRIREFELKYPERFVQNGIAEQDMVSMAAGIASQGLLPVVNSFANFLASRANEQMYNNATEGRKIIYVLHYSGLIPAGPGKSHQSIRDISLLGALPNCIIIQPGSPTETQQALEYCVDVAQEQCILRLIIGPSPRNILMPERYTLTYGQGISLKTGNDGLLFTHGPVMLHEALTASEILAEQGYDLQVVNMPWINRCDQEWLAAIVQEHDSLFVLEDHAPFGGLGDNLLNELVTHNLLERRTFKRFAVQGYPAFGRPDEVLLYHQMNGASIAESILQTQ